MRTIEKIHKYRVPLTGAIFAVPFAAGVMANDASTALEILLIVIVAGVLVGALQGLVLASNDLTEGEI